MIEKTVISKNLRKFFGFKLFQNYLFLDFIYFFSKMLKEIKRKLMMRDEKEQISAVKEIQNGLYHSNNQRQKQFIEELLRFNIGNVLCDILGTCHRELLIRVSECLSMLCSSRNFFANGIAHLAVDRILKTSYLLLPRREKYEEVILEILYTLKTIFVGAENRHVPLCSFCDNWRMLQFLNDLEIVESTDIKLKMTVVRIFRRILHYSQIPEEEEGMELLGKIIEDQLESMDQVIKAQANSKDPIVQTAMKHVSTMCCEAVRLCEVIQNTYHYGMNFPTAPKSLHDSLKLRLITLTTKSLTNSLIPHLKHLNPLAEASRSILTDFLTCLTTLYDLDDFDHSELSGVIATSGYLKYLYQRGIEKLDKIDSLISPISRILSKILTSLAIDERRLGRVAQGIEKSSDIITEFRELLCQGLLTSMETKSTASNEFLTLIYYHHLATNEEITISLDAIIQKILELSVEGLEPPGVRILWFFLSKLMMRAGEKPRELSTAVHRLFEAVRGLGVDECFLDDVDVVRGVLAHPLGDRIRLRVLEIWVDAHGDVEEVRDCYTEENLVLSLWQLMKIASVKSVKKVKKCLEVLIPNKKIIERKMRKILIESLPEILADCESVNSHNLTSILQLFRFVGCNEFPEDFGILCAPNIIRIFTNKSIDVNLKILVMSFAFEILKFCGKKSDSRVAIIFISKWEVIEELRTQAFHSEYDKLSGACLKILTVILMSQNEFSLTSEKVLIIEEMKLYTLLKRSESVWMEHMKFLLIILSELVDKPILKIGEFSSDNKRDEVIYGIYEQVITLHERSRPDQWPILYKLMSTVLNFCKRRNLKKTLHRCLDFPGHYFLVLGAIIHKDTCPEFFNFIIDWIKTSIDTSTQNVEYELLSIEKRKNNQWAPRLQFGRALSEIDDYLDSLKKSKKIELKIVENLETLLKTFK